MNDDSFIPGPLFIITYLVLFLIDEYVTLFFFFSFFMYNPTIEGCMDGGGISNCDQRLSIDPLFPLRS